MKSILLIILLAIPCSAATTYYVRAAGGTTAQCTGTTNADYPGSGTGQPCAYKDMADALAIVTFGDTIKVHAGDTITTQPPTYAFAEWSLANKGTPPTDTDADYITITTDTPLLTPSALSGYPTTLTRITTAMAIGMPHLRAGGSTPLFRVANGAKYWKLERLDMSNTDNGYNNIVLIGQADPGPASFAEVPHHITIQYNWIHPIEETGTVLTSGNIARTAQNAIYLAARNFTLQYNSLQGFVGRVKYGGDAGTRMTSAGWLAGFFAQDALVQNNLIEAWTYGFFSGGSAMPDWTVTSGGTVVSCASTTICTLSNVTNLNVGDPISFLVSTASPATWGASFVSNITGSVVTLDFAPCHSYNGNNSCTAIPGAPIPALGDKVRWKGLQPNNLLFKQNIFAHYPEWTSLMDGDCGGKGYLEVKSGTSMIFDGNIFTGCTGSTITVRNQGGDFPWASLDGLTFSNNYWQGSNQPMVGFLSDSSPTPRTQNVTWTNNLIVGLLGDTAFFPGGVLSGNFQAGTNVTISHNTVAWSKLNNPPMTANAYQNYINFWQRSIGGVTYSATMIGLTVKDNILPVAANICFTDAGAGSNQPMSSCWPSAVVNHNVLVNADSYLMSDINEWWLTYFPSNSLAADYAAVQFTTLDTNLDSSGNYKLLASSPYHNAASDGTDIGVNIDQLFAHIYGVQGPIGISGKFQINGKFRIGQ